MDRDDRVAVLVDVHERRNPLKWPIFEGIARAAGAEAFITHSLTRPARYVIGWGYGSWWQHHHVAASGGFAMLDLGYFGRRPNKSDVPVRVAFGRMHNPELVARDWPSDRWEQLGIALRDDYAPAGPIIIVGQGRKSCMMYGEKMGEWERRKVAEAQEISDGRQVLFRPKPGRGHLKAIKRVPSVEGAIEDVLRGASLVVARHSNVAIDALIAGIPTVCEGGLASAICPHEVTESPRLPSMEDRQRVLHCAAYLNWSQTEAADGSMWQWLRNQIL